MVNGDRTLDTFTCDLCGSHRSIIRDRLRDRAGLQRTKFTVAACAVCGLASLYPVPTEQEMAAIYAGYAGVKDREGVEAERLQEAYPHKLSRLSALTPGRKLLDIGSGLGTFVSAARRAGFDAAGVEYEKGQCDEALRRWGGVFINGRIEDVYAHLGRFDVVHMHHVLEHVRSPRRILGIVRDLLNPGGVALIEVPNQLFNMTDRLRDLFFGAAQRHERLPDHLFFFSPRTLIRYIDRAAFDIIAVNQFAQKGKSGIRVIDIPKMLYRAAAQRLGIAVGGLIEIYLRKRP